MDSASTSSGIEFYTCTFKVDGEKCTQVVATLPNGDKYRKGWWGEKDSSEEQLQWKYWVINNRELL